MLSFKVQLMCTSQCTGYKSMLNHLYNCFTEVILMFICYKVTYYIALWLLFYILQVEYYICVLYLTHQLANDYVLAIIWQLLLVCHPSSLKLSQKINILYKTYQQSGTMIHRMRDSN